MSAKRPGREDIVGKVFGYYKILQDNVGSSKGGHILSRVLCIPCDTIHVRPRSGILSGRLKSCGCMSATLVSKARTTHGHTRAGKQSSEHAIWSSMKQRCFDKNHKQYPDYGGRGISICPQWKNDFASFLAYVGRRPSLKHSIDRIDNDGSYEPGNVRWATIKEQQRNRRSNRYIEFNGERKTVAEWAEWLGFNQLTLGARIRNGWSTEKAFTTPLRDWSKNRRKYVLPPARRAI